MKKKSFVAGTTGHGVGLVQAAKYQGQATSVSSASLTVTSAPFTAGAFNPVDGLPSHYIQITSGTQTGLVVDILSNTTSVITVESGDLADARRQKQRGQQNATGKREGVLQFIEHDVISLKVE